MMIAAAFLSLAAALVAQAQTTPAFDVVSIRAVPPNTPPTTRSQDFTPILPGGRFVDARTTVASMLAIAYDVKFPDMLILGLPAWANQKSFAVSASPAPDFSAIPPAENREQVRVMLRSMLADRFHLQLHTEFRQKKIFKLSVAKGGFRIKEVDPPVPPAHEGYVGAAGNNNGGGRMVGNKSTMSDLASTLTLMMGQQVLDETNLKGYYDFDIKWAGTESPDGQPHNPQFGSAEFVGPLISALNDQFGLRIASTTGPVEYWVVDHVEPPTDN